MKTSPGLLVPRVALCFLLAVTAPWSLAWACNVPVFRYALEHWAPDAYRGVVFHRGPLSTEDQSQLAFLQSQFEGRRVNLSIRTVDLDDSSNLDEKRLLDAASRLNPGAPAGTDETSLVVQLPAYLEMDQPIWIGNLHASTLATLLDSSVRQSLLQKLADGQTAVWVLIDSGDPAQDDVAAATLEQELAELTRTLTLPELTDSPEDIIQDGPPVRVEFSLIRIRRDDPAEQDFIALLQSCEPDLATLNEPMVFPVFGRCRALLPLVGAGIASDTIRSSAAFLAGACSCQVKELNPGFDLLITADWRQLLSWAKLPATAGLDHLGKAPKEAELVPIPPGSAKGEATSVDTTPPEVKIPIASADQNQTPATSRRTQFGITQILILAGGVLLIAGIVSAQFHRG
ncbi:hypothetical protein [Schlesneria sp. T3-172]|uniref:hypothetical protein n=1 Tax=Schlesneria sphaerica TaxID=3373610 RepID=UPI0037C6C2E6